MTSCPTAKYWHSVQGGKDIYNIEVPLKTKVPANWAKQGTTGVSCFSRSSYHEHRLTPGCRKSLDT